MMAGAHVKAALRQVIGQGFNEWLVPRFTAAQLVKIDVMLPQINLAAQQAMGPERIDFPKMPQDFDRLFDSSRLLIKSISLQLFSIYAFGSESRRFALNRITKQ
jgi:hypothetical protein